MPAPVSDGGAVMHRITVSSIAHKRKQVISSRRCATRTIGGVARTVPYHLNRKREERGREGRSYFVRQCMSHVVCERVSQGTYLAVPGEPCVVERVSKSIVREIECPYTAVLTHTKDMRGSRTDHLVAYYQRLMNALFTAGGGRSDPDPTGLRQEYRQEDRLDSNRAVLVASPVRLGHSKAPVGWLRG